MDDTEFLQRLKERIESSTAVTVEVDLDTEDPCNVSVDFTAAVPRVIVGADALKYPGLARMLMQYAILCLKTGRVAPQEEFLAFLRRN